MLANEWPISYCLLSAFSPKFSQNTHIGKAEALMKNEKI